MHWTGRCQWFSACAGRDLLLEDELVNPGITAGRGAGLDKEHSSRRVRNGAGLGIWASGFFLEYIIFSFSVRLSILSDGKGRIQIVTESQNQLCWERPLRSSSPTHDLTPPWQWNHGTECCIQSWTPPGDSTTSLDSHSNAQSPFLWRTST